MVIGRIEGHYVFYDEDEKSVTCKDLKCLGKDIVEAFESSMDKIIIPSTAKEELIMLKQKNIVRLGCFKIGIDQSELLIKTIKKCLKTS